MGKDTKIEWADNTWSPWHGCARVSEACRFCYAEALSKRNPKTLGIWGTPAQGGTRVVASPSSWEKVLGWQRAAAAAGETVSVFPSLCDPFEDFPGLDQVRAWFWALIVATPNLRWLLLTKRPENVRHMAPALWVHNAPEWPRNVWLGTTVENQAEAGNRIPHLLRIPAPMLFLSCEPLLSAINLAAVDPCWAGLKLNDGTIWTGTLGRIGWVICGGESGHHARPMHPTWAADLRDQCERAGVPFHFKQWGEWAPIADVYGNRTVVIDGEEYEDGDFPLNLVNEHQDAGQEIVAMEPSGCIPHWEKGDKFRVDHQPRHGSWWMARVGKTEAGRELDGRIHDAFPEVAHV